MIKKMIPAIILISFVLSGCASVYTLTSEEEDLIAEYAAGVAVKKFKETYGFIEYIPDKSQRSPDAGNNTDMPQQTLDNAQVSGNVTDEIIAEYIKNQDLEERKNSDNFNISEL